MSAFPDWQKYAVHQKRTNTGCIPTAYEMILRAADIKGVDFNAFQDDFDLDKNGGKPRNHFVSIGEAVTNKYPNIKFQCEPFKKGDGAKKLARVEEFIGKKLPVVVSIANEAYGGKGWHIMPVVDATADDLELLEYVDKQGNKKTKKISKKDFVAIHDKFAGGDEIAYLSAPSSGNSAI